MREGNKNNYIVFGVKINKLWWSFVLEHVALHSIDLIFDPGEACPVSFDIIRLIVSVADKLAKSNLLREKNIAP